MDIATAGGLVEQLDPSGEVGVGSVEFALLHQPNFVVGRSVELVFDGFAAGLVADVQALHAVFDKLTVLGHVIGESRGPLGVVLGVEGFKLRRADRRSVGSSLG